MQVSTSGLDHAASSQFLGETIITQTEAQCTYDIYIYIYIYEELTRLAETRLARNTFELIELA